MGMGVVPAPSKEDKKHLTVLAQLCNRRSESHCRERRECLPKTLFGPHNFTQARKKA